MAQTMKAAVVEEFGKPLVIKQVPKPVAGAGEIVVKVEVAGLCHTDIHAANGDWPIKPKLPLIPGHEGVGIVDSVGAGVSHIKVGERVAIPWLHTACGMCEFCQNGWETLCPHQQMTGYTVDGSYAEFVKADAKFVAKVPEGVNSAEAAPITCAGVTTYKAVKVSEVRSSDLCAVFGIGGLGHLALQYAVIAGATVAAVDLAEEKLELAKELGATYTVNAKTEDPVAAIQKLGGADAAICLAVSARAIEQAYNCLKPGGRLVLVALPADNHVSLPIFETVLKGIKVIGSIVGTRKDLDEALELHALGRTKVIYETRTLEEVNECFHEVEKGHVKARIVLKI